MISFFLWYLEHYSSNNYDQTHFGKVRDQGIFQMYSHKNSPPGGVVIEINLIHVLFIYFDLYLENHKR